jgi:hypothetical protein
MGMSGVVVFTGRGVAPSGNFHERSVWESWAKHCGYDVADKVDFSTRLLVASRTDTAKAKAAAAKGVRVVNYATFHRMLSTGSDARPNAAEAEVKAGAKAKPFPSPEPSNEEIEGWGSWA